MAMTFAPQPANSAMAVDFFEGRVSLRASGQGSGLVRKATTFIVAPWFTGKVRMWPSGPIWDAVSGGWLGVLGNAAARWEPKTYMHLGISGVVFAHGCDRFFHGEQTSVGIFMAVVRI